MNQSLDPPDRLVSVIVPAFNAEATIAETLASVSAQSHANIEIIIVNDGSTDRTGEIAHQFCQSDKRARVVFKQNGGVASARNLGLAEARGAYVAPIDADDLWHPDFVRRLLTKAIFSPHAPALIFASYHRIDAASNLLWSGPSYDVEGYAVRQMAFTNLVGNGSGMLIKRDAALAAGGYEERLRAVGLEGCEDFLLQLKIAARHPIAATRAYLVGYRRLAGAMSNNKERMCGSSREAIRLFSADYSDVNIEDFIWRWSDARRDLSLARYNALKRRPARAINYLIKAVWRDPLAALAALEHDVRRVFSLAKSRFAPKRSPQPFHSLGSRIPYDETVRANSGRSLASRLTHARMRKLAALDQQKAISPVTQTLEAEAA